MTTITQQANYSFQEACSHVKRFAEMKIYKDWTIYEITKVVAVVSGIFIGLNYLFGASLLKALAVCQWYRFIYQPFDSFVLFTSALTSICSIAWSIFSRFIPEDIDIASAKQLTVPQLLQSHGESISTTPTDFWGKCKKEQLLGLLLEKVQEDVSTLRELEEPFKRQLSIYWKGRMGIPAQLEQCTTKQLIRFRPQILAAREEISWEHEAKRELSAALIRRIEQYPAELPSDDSELIESLCKFTLKSYEQIDNESIDEMIRRHQQLPEREAPLPWEKTMRETLEKAIASKIDVNDIQYIPINLLVNVKNILINSNHQRNIPFLLNEISQRNRNIAQVSTVAEREFQYFQDRLQNSILNIANVLNHEEGENSEAVQTARSFENAKWCLEIQNAFGSLLSKNEAYRKTSQEILEKFYLSCNTEVSEQRNTLMDLLISQYEVFRLPSDLIKIKKLIPEVSDTAYYQENNPKLQKLLAITLSAHLSRLVINVPQNSSPNKSEIAANHEPLFELIKKCKLPFELLSYHFSRDSDIQIKGGFSIKPFDQGPLKNFVKGVVSNPPLNIRLFMHEVVKLEKRDYDQGFLVDILNSFLLDHSPAYKMITKKKEPEELPPLEKDLDAMSRANLQFIVQALDNPTFSNKVIKQNLKTLLDYDKYNMIGLKKFENFLN